MFGRNLIRVIGSTAALLAFAMPAAAHEKWFYEGGPEPTRWNSLAEGRTLGLMAAAVALTAAAAGWQRLRGGRDLLPGPAWFKATPENRRIFYAWVPLILAVHVAVPLLVYGVEGKLFSPNHQLHGAARYLLGLLQTGAALSLLYGGFTRVGAAILAGVWFIGLVVVGVEPMLENALYLGFAGFFFLAGRGPHAVDRLLLPRLEPSAGFVRSAIFPLRIGVGVSLIVVAFTEKLANLPLALAFLKQFPLNFTPYLGIAMPDDWFVLCAGAVELLIGLFILFGIFPRTIIVIAWLPFNLTLTVFNWVELVGHLPFYGALAVLLVWTPDPDDQRLWVEGVTSRL